MKIKWTIGLFMWLGFLQSSWAQTNMLDQEVTITYHEVPIILAIQQLEELVGVTFAYNKKDFDRSVKVTAQFRNTPLSSVLNALLAKQSCQYKIVGKLIVFFATEKNSVKKKSTIHGYILDRETGEALIGCSIYDEHTGLGTSSNQFGFYSITLPQDSISLIFSYVGYQTVVLPLDLQADLNQDVKLSSSVELATVEVVASVSRRIQEETQMSKVEIPVEQIKKVPALLGEVDVLKTLQLLPGVQSGGEGQSGLYVRGGSPDQNLVLLDGVPVYNVSHLLGVFSVFNADAIKSVRLTKGGFPARFGGRLSSVLEINMKEGNMQEFHGEGSLGLISSKLTLEGPIAKDKVSFLISGRRTYADLIFRPIIKKTQPEGVSVDPTLYFYDLNAKINYKINDRHRIYLSGYAGSDTFKNKYSEKDIESNGGIDWGNIIGVVRWNYKITDKLFSNVTLTHSNYDIDIFAENKTTDGFFKANYLSGIQDWSGKLDLDFIPTPNHYIRFGGSMTHHRYRPGALGLEVTDNSAPLDTMIGSQTKSSREYDLYVEDEIRIGRFNANLGIHGSAFNVDGHTYTSVQPRIGLKYALNREVSLKASFSTMTQFINLLTSESLSLPTDLWVPSTKQVKPQESWQVAAGVATTLWNDFEFSVEGYYKEMKNVLSFKEGASFLLGLDNDWQNKITQGKGVSYGLEFFLQKKVGKTTGWVGYTWSKNDRQFKFINGGEKFPFRYDRRHDISIVASHQITPKISISAAWIYGTGNAITLPIYRYPTVSKYDGLSIFDQVESLGKKNDFRMSNYHRLDFSVEFFKKKKKYERKWIVGAYNTYWHRNPYYVTARNEAEFGPSGEIIGQKRSFKEISILPIIPSISYAFKF